MRLLQTLIDHIYRFPKAKQKTIKRFGGHGSYYKMMQGKRLMQKASESLPAINSDPLGFKIYFLTGKSHIYQTLFCAFSLCKTSEEKFQFILIDDGSFTPKIIKKIYQRMPGVKIITSKEVDQNLQRVLPIERFPYLHHKREVYPHIRKLTDVHSLPERGFKLVLDSDMLFWKNPTEITDWLKKPIGSIHMLDCVESYGYPKESMSQLCRCKIPDLVNVGVLGLDSAIINWVEIEKWSKNLEKNGASYFLEQALSAMLIAKEKRIALNNNEYVVNPNPSERNIDSVKLCHYVDLSKKQYLNSEWKKIL
ncbi:hypothetical protein [Pedobacter sp. R-06]|uniref:hypothetical protein n=1 Tax=Pedobacter sp. R-06 TaxID=3404051 RepID=UPI003CF84EA9